VETRRVLFAVSDDSGCRKDSRFPQPRPARDLAGSFNIYNWSWRAIPDDCRRRPSLRVTHAREDGLTGLYGSGLANDAGGSTPRKIKI